MNDSIERAAKLRVFFGHQSVGANVVDGVREVAATKLRTVEVTQLTPASLATPGLAHAFVGTNEQPLTKIAAFEKALAELDGQVDVAFFKFCYVDFSSATDVEALFSAYEQAMARLKAKYPRVTFGYVTVPLTVVQGGFKGWVKRQLGKGAWGEQENVKRHAFNEKLRAAHKGEPLFDLARIESTRDDGKPETYEVGGATVPKLRADFTDDGGHLNAKGKREVARALLEFLGTQRPGAAPPGGSANEH